MTSTYFKRLREQTSLWEPPPPAADPGWFDGFASASDLEKTNIATNWLWVLNNEYRASDTECRANFSAQYIHSYATAAPWVRREHFLDSPYDGTPQALLLSDEPGVWNHVDPDTRDLFTDAFRRAAMDPRADKVAAFGDLEKAIKGADKHGQRQLTRFYPLILTSLWLEETKHEHLDIVWQRTLVKLSVTCATADGIPPRNDAVSALKSLGNAWMRLAYFACNSFTVDSTVGEELRASVINTNPTIAVEAFTEIFTQIMGVGKLDGLFLRGNTVMNPGKKDSSDIYSILRKWVPAYTDLWTTAEGLDLPLSLALEQATALPTIQPKLSLPTDLSSDTQVRHN